MLALQSPAPSSLMGASSGLRKIGNFRKSRCTAAQPWCALDRSLFLKYLLFCVCGRCFFFRQVLVLGAVFFASPCDFVGSLDGFFFLQGLANFAGGKRQ